MKLIIMRGLPASGKTTYANKWVAEDPVHRARVNRDSLRAMISAGVYVPDSDAGEGTERAIKFARDALIKVLLERNLDVICDDTNLPNKTVRELYGLATFSDADVEVIDLTNVPLEDCLLRNKYRGPDTLVPESVILNMHERYIKGRAYPLPVDLRVADVLDPESVEPYVPVLGTPPTILVDLDGTVAHMNTRSPFDPDKVHEDRPNRDVIHAVRAHAVYGSNIVFVSGRSDACRDATVTWLKEHVLDDLSSCKYPPFRLHMRRDGDTRPDWQIKLEIFNTHIRSYYNVIGVFDDRQQVVDMWRALGLTVFQVADGKF